MEPVLPYYAVLRRIHETLRPRTYVEVGVHYGRAIVLAEPGTRCLGIDPEPMIETPLPETTIIVESTSDEFFDHRTVADQLGRPADMAFIDGRHLFEYALRDFRAVERDSTPGSVILFHDCHPKDVEWGSRGVRSGDVWKLLLALREFRPDLTVSTIEAPPTGLGLVTGLDPGNRVLWDRYAEIMDRIMPLEYSDVIEQRDFPVNSVPSTWTNIRPLLPDTPFRAPGITDVVRVKGRRTRTYLRKKSKFQYRRWKRRLTRT
jgi:hypothetical protein